MKMRTVVHPGPADVQRMSAVACSAEPLSIRLRAGRTVNEAVAEGLADHGFRSGYIVLRDVMLAPLAFVIPAPAPAEDHIAWYSETFSLASAKATVAGCMTGFRDGAPFLHCHGLWSDGGQMRMGHLLPLDSRLAEDAVVEAWGIEGSAMVARADAETNFTLFKAEAVNPPGVRKGRPAILASIRPNQEIGRALERLARAHGPGRYEVLGIGSLVGCRFADGREVAWHANEALILQGEADGGSSRLDVAMVDRDGRIETGRLMDGANAVSVTFEVLMIKKG